MAYYRLEPFGELIADMRHGTATAVLANIHGGGKVHKSDDFIHWRDTGNRIPDEPVLLTDPVQHSQLMRAQIFGKTK